MAQSLVLEHEEFLRCRACNSLVSCNKRAKVNQHCFGVGHNDVTFADRPQADKMSLGHYKALLQLEKRNQEQGVLEKAVAEWRVDMFAKHGASVVGATLPVEHVAQRMEVLLACWRAGIPIAKLDDPDFVYLIEQHHNALGGREGVRLTIPAAVKTLVSQVNKAVSGRMLSIYFDGAMVNEMAECVIVRLLTDAFEIRHLCIGVSMISRSMDSITLKEAVRAHLAEVEVADAQIVSATSDSASVNSHMVELWNESAKTFYGNDYDARCLFWIGCFSHGLSNSGTALRKKAAGVKAFFSPFKKMANTSATARSLYQSITGVACPQVCDNRWFHWFECAEKVHKQWKFMPKFITELCARGYAAKSAAKMQAVWKGSDNMWLTVEMELRAVLSFGKLFRDYCELLEGDGFVLPYLAQCLRTLRHLCRDVMDQQLKHPLFAEIAKSAQDAGLSPGYVEALMRKIRPVVGACLDHFKVNVWEKITPDRMELFDAVAIFHPLVFLEKSVDPKWGDTLVTHCERLSNVKGIPRMAKDFRMDLIREQPVYTTEAQKFKASIAAEPQLDKPKRVWQWWREVREKLPSWFAIAKILVLIQPSSAIAERFYSIVKSSTSEQQNAEYADTFKGRCMALFNK